MAIDYDSGSGLFDKVGTVVSLANALDTWQTSTSAGNLEKEFSDLEAKLEDTKQFDAVARDLLLNKWNQYRDALNRMKARLVDLVRLLMASEIVFQEYLDSENLSDLLAHLVQAMRRDSETVDANGVGGLSTGLISAGNLHSASFVGSPRDVDVTAEASCQYQGRAKADTFHFEVTSVSPGTEAISMYGTEPVQSVGDPNWERGGIQLSNYAIRAFDRNNLLTNGSFLGLDSSNRLNNWIFSGTYGTDVSIVPSTNYGASPKVIQYLATKNGRFSQNLTRLKANTKYYIAVSVDNYDGTCDGNFNFGIGSVTASYNISGVLDPDVNFLEGFFSTQDQVLDIPVYFERVSGTAGGFKVLGIGVWEMTLLPSGFWGLIVNFGVDESVSPYPKYPTVLGIADSNAVTVTNDHAGLFQTYFSRFLGTLLPGNSSNTETISDTLAA